MPDCHRPARWENPDTGECDHPNHDQKYVIVFSFDYDPPGGPIFEHVEATIKSAIEERFAFTVDKVMEYKPGICKCGTEAWCDCLQHPVSECPGTELEEGDDGYLYHLNAVKVAADVED